MQGSDSASLWRQITLCSSCPDMAPNQLSGLHNALVKQARFATSVRLFGGGRDLMALRSLVRAASGVQDLRLHHLNLQSEAVTLGLVATWQPQWLSQANSQAVIGLPESLQTVSLLIPADKLPDDSLLRAQQVQERLNLLQPLSALRQLVLLLDGWCMTSAQSHQLVDWLPRLEMLQLILTAHPAQSHELAPLSRLAPTCELSLALLKHTDSLDPLLQQLLVVQPVALVIASGAYAVTQAEVLLACSAAQAQLVVCSSSSARLPHQPVGPQVSYRDPEKNLLALGTLLNMASWQCWCLKHDKL